MRVAETTSDEVAMETMTDAIAEGIRLALLKHKRAGNPIATWRDGAVAWIAPEDIEVDED